MTLMRTRTPDCGTSSLLAAEGQSLLQTGRGPRCRGGRRCGGRARPPASGSIPAHPTDVDREIDSVLPNRNPCPGDVTSSDMWLLIRSWMFNDPSDEDYFFLTKGFPIFGKRHYRFHGAATDNNSDADTEMEHSNQTPVISVLW